MIKVYMAGPQVFLPDAAEKFEEWKAEAAKLGLEALSPFDSEVGQTTGENRESLSREIYNANLRLIRQCECVVADVTPFRGTELDSGTAFEIGFATALGKTVVQYNRDNRTVLSRTKAYYERIARVPLDDFLAEQDTMPDGMKVENFGHSTNLMIHHSGVATARDIITAFKDARYLVETAREMRQKRLERASTKPNTMFFQNKYMLKPEGGQQT